MDKKLPLDPKAELLKWGPTPRYPLVRYHTAATGLFKVFPKLYPGYSWPNALILSTKNRFIWMHDHSEIREHGRKLFLDMMLPKDQREKVRTAWKQSVYELNKLEATIGNDVTPFSDEELETTWTEFHRITDDFWGHATLPELSNYGSSEMLEQELKTHLPAEKVASALEVLCAPEGLSFYQEEEIDLAESDDVAAHQQKYFWLKNSYGNIEILPVDFFEKRKNEISLSVRRIVTERIARAHAEKDALQKKYGLPGELRDIADAIADGMHWQDMRKKDIWVYLHYEWVLLTEIAKRLHIDPNLLAFAAHDEIPALMHGQKPFDELQSRLEGVGIHSENTEIHILGPEAVHEYWKIYVAPTIEQNVSEFRGTIASKGGGIVQGRVQIILDPHGDVDFADGDVLVTTMTTPEFIFVMKKASAIITDTGGLTSHAAIVSRELGVPCLVGTKVATQVLKDGDMVEVDADKGIVRKL